MMNMTTQVLVEILRLGFPSFHNERDRPGWTAGKSTSQNHVHDGEIYYTSTVWET